MVKNNFKNFVEKFGKLTGEPRVVPAGTSKTGKSFDSFAFFKMIEVDAEDSEPVYFPVDEFTKFEAATAELPWACDVNVTGYRDAQRRFVAVDIAPFNMEDLNE